MSSEGSKYWEQQCCDASLTQFHLNAYFILHQSFCMSVSTISSIQWKMGNILTEKKFVPRSNELDQIMT